MASEKSNLDTGIANLNINTQKPTETTQSTYTYAILQETSGEESESWLYFIRYQGNEDMLKHLNKQLERVDWYIVDDLSTFDLELDYLVSEQTAKEMTKIDLNHYSFHRKFDGKLEKIDLGIKDSHSNEKKMAKVFDVLGYGKIEEYIDEEDIDPEDMISDDNDDNEEESTDEDDNGDNEDNEEESTDEEETKKETKEKTGRESGRESGSKTKEETKDTKPKNTYTKPKFDIPRFAKAKKKHR